LAVKNGPRSDTNVVTGITGWVMVDRELRTSIPDSWDDSHYGTRNPDAAWIAIAELENEPLKQDVLEEIGTESFEETKQEIKLWKRSCNFKCENAPNS
jgi:hypothetical protein